MILLRNFLRIGDRAGTSFVTRVRLHRRERALREKKRRGAANDDKGDQPANDSLTDDIPVDALGTFETGDPDSGTDLAVRRRKRPAETRTHNDHARGAEFDANATARSELANLRTKRVKNLVTIKS